MTVRPEGDFLVDEREDDRRRAMSFELLAVVWRRKRLVLLVVILCVLTATLLSLRQTKQYEASGSLLFRDPGFARTLYGNDLFDQGQDPKRAAQTNVDVVGSLRVARAARDVMRSREDPASLLDDVTVEPSSDSNVATITARRTSPDDAARVANAFAKGYIDYRQETDRAAIQQAKNLIQESLNVASPEDRPGLLRSMRQLEELRTLQTGNAEVIAPAVPDASPVSPKPKRNAVFGLILGLLAGCGLALAVDLLDRRLQRDEDVEEAYEDFRLLATIPEDPRADEGDMVGGQTAESYRMLREGMRFLDPGSTTRCVVITSADEAEGKSTVARQFAEIMASSGQDVVLVEADMRRPTAATKLGLDWRSYGMSNALQSVTPVRDLLQQPPGDASTLWVLAAGPMPARPADLLRTPRASEILTELRQTVDLVIIDAPPLLPVADTRALLQLPQIDGVIMVGRTKVTRRDRAAEARRVLRQTNRHVIGLVITGGSSNSGSSYYGESEGTASRWRAGRRR